MKYLNRDKWNQIWKGFAYYLTAGHQKGHGIHSPAAFRLISEIIYSKEQYPDYTRLREARKWLASNHEKLNFENRADGSKVFSNGNRKVSDLVRYSSVSTKFSFLLYRLAKAYKPDIIIELGTSVGFSTLALHLGNPEAEMLTVEKEKCLVEFSAEWIEAYQKENLKFLNASFDQALEDIRFDKYKNAMVFIDGNHHDEATLKYFWFFQEKIKKGILVFDDIYWSLEMTSAWKQIQKESLVSVDLFQMGIVLIQDSITPGKYTVRF